MVIVVTLTVISLAILSVIGLMAGALYTAVRFPNGGIVLPGLFAGAGLWLACMIIKFSPEALRALL